MNSSLPLITLQNIPQIRSQLTNTDSTWTTSITLMNLGRAALQYTTKPHNLIKPWTIVNGFFSNHVYLLVLCILITTFFSIPIVEYLSVSYPTINFPQRQRLIMIHSVLVPSFLSSCPIRSGV